MGATRTAALTVSCLLAGCPAAYPVGVRLGGSLALTRDDVYRGLSQTCGHPAAQGSIDVRTQGSSSWDVFGGVWGSKGLSGTECGSARELDVFAGYSIALTPDLGFSLIYTRYAFPGGGYGNPHLYGRRYDYDQIGLTANVQGRLYATLAWTPDALRYERYDGRFGIEADRSAFSYGLEWRQPLASWLTLTAGGGYDRMADPGGTGYGFYSIGLANRTGPLELSVAYFRAAGRAERLFGPEVAGGRVSATVLWRF
jgi:uncharacterized protein (TIGR02001 family)